MSGLFEFVVTAVEGISAIVSYFSNNRKSNNRKNNDQTAREFEEKKRLQRQRIKESGIKQKIGNYRNEIHHLMEEQTNISMNVSKEMEKDFLDYQDNVENIMAANATNEIKDMEMAISKSGKDLMKSYKEKEKIYITAYKEKIESTVHILNKEADEFYQDTLSNIEKLHDDKEKRMEELRNLAITYYKEAEAVTQSIMSQYPANFVRYDRLQLLETELKKAVSLINEEHYDAAIIACMQVFSEAKLEILETDVRVQEHENRLKNAILALTDVKSFLEDQFVISKDMVATLEESLGHALDYDIVGYELKNFTGYNSQNTKTKYEQLKDLVESSLEELDKNGNSISNESLTVICEKAACEWKKEAVIMYVRAIHCLDNALSRQKYSDLIIDQFEEQNFSYAGYMYAGEGEEGNAYVDEEEKSLYLKFENDSEEIVVVLEPKEQQDGAFATKASVHLIKGDPNNEARLHMLQDGVINVVSEGAGYKEAATGVCVDKTKGKLSSNNLASKQITKTEEKRAEVENN